MEKLLSNKGPSLKVDDLFYLDYMDPTNPSQHLGFPVLRSIEEATIFYSLLEEEENRIYWYCAKRNQTDCTAFFYTNLKMTLILKKGTDLHHTCSYP